MLTPETTPAGEQTKAAFSPHSPFNDSGFPAGRPAGFSASPPGLPLSIQIVGKPFAEETVYAAAMLTNPRLGWHERRPPLRRGRAQRGPVGEPPNRRRPRGCPCWGPESSAPITQMRRGACAAAPSPHPLRGHPSGFHDGRMLLTVAGKDKFVQKHLDSFKACLARPWCQ